MHDVNRRRFLQIAGGGVATTLFSDSIARALAIPANRTTRSIRDIEHIVVLMQENRSFDHYFGTLRGVRGFGDPHPVTLPSGQPVWFQAQGSTVIPPFRPDVGNLALTFIEDLDHSWAGTHEMWNAGNWDQWLPSKTKTTMAHLERRDLPFHAALADAFTVCDANFCSLLGPTDPNRYYMWTGWVGNDGQGGGPVIANDEIGYDWHTYPERLQANGVSWKIYQDIGDGLTAAGAWGWTGEDPFIGNFGDNSLLYFHQYQNAPSHSPLAELARTGTDLKATGNDLANANVLFSQLAADVKGDKLPQVSWIVAPQAYTEHPAFPPGYGAWYTAQCLNALTSNPDVWSKTALIITFDENDGFFDHIPGHTPAVGGLSGESTVPLDNEFFDGTAGTPGGSNGVPGPYGLGIRVPLLIVSPWSTGGWVCSETFDHTSLIRFIEARFGVDEPNITPFRRAVCGDLTAAFDFETAQDRVPPLPSVAAYKPTSETVPPDFVPTPPANGSVPTQEPGVRPSRRLGYDLEVGFDAAPQGLRLRMRNRGSLGAGLQARSLTVIGAPYSYTIGAGDKIDTVLPNPGTFDLSVHGPNGFFRHFAGSGSPALKVDVSSDRAPGRLRVQLHPESRGRGRQETVVHIADAFGPDRTLRLRGDEELLVDTNRNGGWYDLALSTPGDSSFSYQLAGRLESARELTSDPQLGRS